ncbi:MAG TPA: type II CAAX endopeptidase family protein [Pyrinomonadaceae bacterium]|jgi:membrane protease YdiL (CAAX protease family)|nr:type II CAAX endopeptidase family protein [Pyrinomonadaceae bacterium]
MDQNSKIYRTLELYLVTGVAFAAPIFVSIYSLFLGSLTQGSQASGVLVFYGLIYELLALAVMTYVLSRQGRSLKDIGVSFSWMDIPVSLLLIVVSYVAFYLCHLTIFYGYFLVVGRAMAQPAKTQTYLQAGITLGTILFVILNPIYEELIVRAYVISEVKYLLGSSVLAVLVSVLIQTLYHLYQGVPAAIALGAMSLVLSIYYLRCKRIVPVILAHLFFDLLALLVYARR